MFKRFKSQTIENYGGMVGTIIGLLLFVGITVEAATNAEWFYFALSLLICADFVWVLSKARHKAA